MFLRLVFVATFCVTVTVFASSGAESPETILSLVLLFAGPPVCSTSFMVLSTGYCNWPFKIG